MEYGKIKFDTFVFTESGVDVETETRDIPTQAELALKDDITSVNTKLADNVTNEDAKLALKDDITSVDTKLALNVTNEDAKLATKADLVAGKLAISQLPELAISSYLGAATNQTAMLALTGEVGDWCTRTDDGKVYLITGADPTLINSWTALTYPAASVTSVAGRTGVVTLSTSDIAGLGTAATTASTDYATAAQGAKADTALQSGAFATVATTGAYNDLSGKPTLGTFAGDSTNGSGQITLNCENNSHGVKIKGPPHSAAANYTLTLPNDTGSVGQALTTNGSGVLSFSSVDSAFIETPQTITTNKVIAANINAGLMGPTVSISSGIAITVGANSLLKVLN